MSDELLTLILAGIIGCIVGSPAPAAHDYADKSYLKDRRAARRQAALGLVFVIVGVVAKACGWI